MSLPQEEIEDHTEIAAGRCPECHANLLALNSCSSCGFQNNLPHAKFCSGCGTPISTLPSATDLRAHAESHWGKDFHLTKVTDDHKAHPDFDENPNVAGVFHDKEHYPDAVRRWHMVTEFDPTGEISVAPPIEPVKVLQAGVDMPANAPGANINTR